MKNLKAIRTARGFSQRGLARKSGISQPAIANIETGRRVNPRYDTVRALAAALGVDPASLVEGPDYARPAA